MPWWLVRTERDGCRKAVEVFDLERRKRARVRLSVRFTSTPKKALFYYQKSGGVTRAPQLLPFFFDAYTRVSTCLPFFSFFLGFPPKIEKKPLQFSNGRIGAALPTHRLRRRA
jgi:hypothetical protein